MNSMTLVSNSGRILNLNQAETADYMRLAQEKGERRARAAAYAGDLPSQITAEVIAARKRVKAARYARQRLRRKLQRRQVREYLAVVQGLKLLCPGIPQIVLNRIIQKRRSKWIPGRELLSGSRLPALIEWNGLTSKKKTHAMSMVLRLLARLNANDWIKIRDNFLCSAFDEQHERSRQQFDKLFRHGSDAARAMAITRSL